MKWLSQKWVENARIFVLHHLVSLIPLPLKTKKKKKKMASHPEKRITWSKWELFSHRFVPYVPCAQEGSKLNSYVVVLEVQIRARSVAGQHYLSKISM